MQAGHRGSPAGQGGQRGRWAHAHERVGHCGERGRGLTALPGLTRTGGRRSGRGEAGGGAGREPGLHPHAHAPASLAPGTCSASPAAALPSPERFLHLLPGGRPVGAPAAPPGPSDTQQRIAERMLGKLRAPPAPLREPDPGPAGGCSLRGGRLAAAAWHCARALPAPLQAEGRVGAPWRPRGDAAGRVHGGYTHLGPPGRVLAEGEAWGDRERTVCRRAPAGGAEQGRGSSRACQPRAPGRSVPPALLGSGAAGPACGGPPPALTLRDVAQALGVEQVAQAGHLVLEFTDELVIGVLVDDGVAADLLGPVGVPGRPWACGHRPAAPSGPSGEP